MKGKFLVFTCIVVSSFFAGNLFAQANPDAIVGIWFNEEKDAKIKVYKENGKFYGKIVWHKTGDDISPYDENNPDPDLQTRKKLGLVILNDFVFDGGQWEDGTIYDPKTGKTYSCIIKTKKDGALYVRGYIGISLIGRTTQWTKAE
jgi:uncharacterized protein (DUF2147 family)